MPPSTQPVVQPGAPKKEAPKERSANEMMFLYGASIGAGVGTGVWIDALGKITDPGAAVVAPALLGAAFPIGIYIWDNAETFGRGVPSSIATGLLLGAGEGVLIASAAAINTTADANKLSFGANASISWLTMIGGGVGGYFFGEWLRPDPRSMSFIASAAGWGLVSFGAIGHGTAASGSAWEVTSILGLVGYNVGIVSAGALSTIFTPSYAQQEYMWLGYGLGAAAGFLVYPFYLFSDSKDIRGGMVANGFGAPRHRHALPSRRRDRRQYLGHCHLAHRSSDAAARISGRHSLHESSAAPAYR